MTDWRLIYRVIQEERSIFLEVTVPVIVRKRVHSILYLILNGYRVELFESPDLTPLD
jgi:hypothetical protein